MFRPGRRRTEMIPLPDPEMDSPTFVTFDPDVAMDRRDQIDEIHRAAARHIDDRATLDDLMELGHDTIMYALALQALRYGEPASDALSERCIGTGLEFLAVGTAIARAEGHLGYDQSDPGRVHREVHAAVSTWAHGMNGGGPAKFFLLHVGFAQGRSGPQVVAAAEAWVHRELQVEAAAAGSTRNR